MKTKWVVLILTLLILLVQACKDEESKPDAETETERQQSAIKVISNTIATGGAKIVLEYPKPFQSLSIPASGGDIVFQFSPQLAVGELYIFDSKPDISSLRAGDLSGCVAGVSSLAGHSWTGTQATLSADETRNQFYECESASAPLSRSRKKILTSGTYYWFVLSYHSNYLLSKSSEVRLLKLN